MTNGVPRVAILERLLEVIQDGYFIYDRDAPAQVERWDIRSMLDYAVKSISHTASYASFYLQRNDVMQLLMERIECLNYGDWRMWETEKDRTRSDIESVIKRALEAEKKRAVKA